MPKPILKLLTISLGILILNGCETTQPMRDLSNTSKHPSGTAFLQSDATTTWNKLQQIPLTKLQGMDLSADPTANGWVKLAIISKRDSENTTLLTQELTVWRAQFPNHPGNALFPNEHTLTSMNSTKLPSHIAVLLPLQGPLAPQGKMIRDGFLNAYYASLAKTHVTQTISFYDTNQNNISDLYQKALANGANFIVGPLSKEEVQTLSSQGSFSVPTLTLNYTDAGFASLPNNLYQFGLSPLDETQQIADKAKNAGLTHAIIIAADNDWGKRTTKSVTTRWQANGGTIQEVLYIAPKTNLTQAIANLLKTNVKITPNTRSSHRNDIDVVFLLTQPQTARQVVPLLRYYYVDNLPIYAASAVYSGSSTQNGDLEGVIFCDTPWTLNMYAGSGNRGNRLYAVGLDAYTLSSNMQRLITLPNFPLYGATGAMTLNANHQIYRRLPGATIHNGSA
jgi:outer membrane PBP1 activator LpoA protein